MPRYFWLVLFFALPLSAQESPDRLRGRIRNDSGLVVAGASIYVTRGSDRAVQQTTSDTDGTWTIRFDDGTGDYLVFVAAPGYQSARIRVQRSGNEREFVVDLVLKASSAAQLATVRVAATGGRRPDNGVRLGTEEVGASERWIDGVAAVLPPTVRGDASATLGTVPGVIVGSDGASLLGAAPGSNLVTLNGVALPAGQLPRGAPVDARFSAGTMDATRGGFAGGQLDFRLPAGNRDMQRRRGWGTLTPSLLQGTDAIGRATGADAGNLRLSGSADGEAIRRAMSYNVSADYMRTTSTPATLITADPGALGIFGLSADSVTRLQSAAAGLGLPVGTTRARSTDSWSLLARIDDTRDTARVLALTAFVSGAAHRGMGASPQLSPLTTNTRTDRATNVQLLHQRTGARRSWFNENRLSVSRTDIDGRARTTAPTAVVITDQTDGALAVLGASPTGHVDRGQWTVEGASEWAWLGRTPAHRFRAIAWSRFDALRDASLQDALGTWSFASLGDFSNSRPSRFTRTLVQPPTTGSAWNGALALAHQWRATPSLQVLSGARIEGNAFGGLPDTPIELGSGNTRPAERLRTDAVPMRVHVSPRIGLTWQLGGGDARSAQMFSSYGTVVRPSMGVLRAGIGEFRDMYQASAVVGTRTGAQLLSCVGAAAPAPNWHAYTDAGTSPASCVGSDPVLTQRAASLRYLRSSYDTPRAWRSYVNYSRNVGPVLARVEAMGAVNLALPGVIDRNLDASRATLLPDEQRLIFVSAEAIDPRSGAVSPATSRMDTRSGLVHEVRSDLRSEAGQISLGISSDIFKRPSPFYSATWTVQQVRQQYRGADGGGFGDPTRIEWARGANDARHVMQLQAGYTLPRQGSLTLFARLQSGIPFTPIVRGDVDGDGIPGDRAFVFDPSRDTDAQRANAMRALLDHSNARVRDCLSSQTGRVVSRQSCSGPWTVSANARIDITVPISVAGRRLSAALNLENLAGGLDLLLHGANTRGWGNTALPDPVLLVPRGFDANASRFLYAVNPRFGSSNPAHTLLRNPFRVTLDFSLDLTKPLAEQRLARTLEPVKRNGNWERPTLADMERVQMRQVSSLHRLLLSFTDTLFLTRDQIDRLRGADSVFQGEARALFLPLAERLAALPSGFAATPVLEDIRATELAYQRRFWAQRDIVRGILTPLQTSVMPEIAKMIMAYQLAPDSRRWPRWFFSDDGSTAGVGPPP
ncbi:carboxypeptidase-like regulatory domain-containing protein [Gemmatimonas aurantiaca]|nr:carboxypeptidase-like regulatory domain-containing protein [Gemmatimonas aurantiaca]